MAMHDLDLWKYSELICVISPLRVIPGSLRALIIGMTLVEKDEAGNGHGGACQGLVLPTL